MQRHSLILFKDDKHLDVKHSRQLDSKASLDAEFEELKVKYNAKEDQSRQTTMGSMGTVGIFKFATGQCRHGKKVELQYNIIENSHTCPKVL